MTIGSLFSGIGGLELGLERAGLGPVLFQVEIDPFATSILAKRWPDAQRFTDVRSVGAANLPRVDVLCGGFPCQDVSLAGKGAGLAGARSGLWFEYLRVISEITPRYVVVENVPGLVRRGLDVVVRGLSDLGYEVEGTRLQAADVGAPHRRERLFLIARRTVADADRQRREWPGSEQGASGPSWERAPLGSGASGDVADANRSEPERSGAARDLAGPPGPAESRGQEWERLRNAAGGGGQDGMGNPNRPRLEGRGLPGSERADERATGAPGGAGTCRPERGTEPYVGGEPDGPSVWLDQPWPAGRGESQLPHEAPRTIPPRSDRNRSRRLKALGNAVVPQCAEVVGWRVRQLMTLHDTHPSHATDTSDE